MNIFPIPEDVAYELGRIDLDHDDVDAMRLDSDCDTTSAVLNSGGLQISRNNRVCKLCGADNLMWVKREADGVNMWVLAYALGPLAGKLHACESKYRP